MFGVCIIVWLTKDYIACEELEIVEKVALWVTKITFFCEVANITQVIKLQTVKLSQLASKMFFYLYRIDILRVSAA